MADSVIEIQNLSKTYKTGFRQKPLKAVDDLSVTIEEGKIVGLVGPNGAGKTSTIHILMGFIRPSNGHVSILGKTPDDISSRLNVGYQPEIFYSYPFLTARQSLHFYGQLSKMDEKNHPEEINAILKRIDLEEAADRVIQNYSKGMIQRLGLAQALIHQPKVLILDEPTTGLDPAGRKLVADIILEEKQRGATILLSTHILADVERVCDYLVVIHKGKVRLADHIERLRQQSDNWRIEASYNGDDLSSYFTDLPVDLQSLNDSKKIIQCAGADKSEVIQRLLTHSIDILRLEPVSLSLEQLYFQCTQKENNHE